MPHRIQWTDELDELLKQAAQREDLIRRDQVKEFNRLAPPGTKASLDAFTSRLSRHNLRDRCSGSPGKPGRTKGKGLPKHTRNTRRNASQSASGSQTGAGTSSNDDQPGGAATRSPSPVPVDQAPAAAPAPAPVAAPPPVVAPAPAPAAATPNQKPTPVLDLTVDEPSSAATELEQLLQQQLAVKREEAAIRTEEADIRKEVGALKKEEGALLERLIAIKQTGVAGVQG